MMSMVPKKMMMMRWSIEFPLAEFPAVVAEMRAGGFLPGGGSGSSDS